MTYNKEAQRRYEIRKRERRKIEEGTVIVNARVAYRGLAVIAETVDDLDRLVNHIGSSSKSSEG